MTAAVEVLVRQLVHQPPRGAQRRADGLRSREEPVVVAAAVAEAIPVPAARQRRRENEVDVLRRDLLRRVGRLQNAVVPGPEVGERRDAPRTHAAALAAQRHADSLAVPEGRFEYRARVYLLGGRNIAENARCIAIERTVPHVFRDAAVDFPLFVRQERRPRGKIPLSQRFLIRTHDARPIWRSRPPWLCRTAR